MAKVYKTKLKIKSKKVLEGLKRMAGTFRFVFNKGIDYQWFQMITNRTRETQMSKYPFLQQSLNSEKKKYEFLGSFDSSLLNKALFCSHRSFTRWYLLRQSLKSKVALIPKYLSRKTEGMRFTLPSVKVFYDHIKVPNLGKINLYEKGYIPQGEKISKVSFSHDGKDWWIAVELESKTMQKEQELKGSLYADFKNDGTLVTNLGTYESVSSLPSYKIVSKRYDKITKKLRRQKRANAQSNGHGKVVVRTSRNMMKTRKSLLKTANKLARIKSDYFRKVASELAKTKPDTVHFLSKDVIRHFKQSYLTRIARAAGTRHFAEVLSRKLKLQGSFIEREEEALEFYKALGSRVCGGLSESKSLQKDIPVKQELLS